MVQGEKRNMDIKANLKNRISERCSDDIKSSAMDSASASNGRKQTNCRAKSRRSVGRSKERWSDQCMPERT